MAKKKLDSRSGGTEFSARVSQGAGCPKLGTEPGKDRRHTGRVENDRPLAMSKMPEARDRKSTRLNSSHGYISYAVFCLKKKKKHHQQHHLSVARRRKAPHGCLAIFRMRLSPLSLNVRCTPTTYDTRSLSQPQQHLTPLP